MPNPLLTNATVSPTVKLWLEACVSEATSVLGIVVSGMVSV